MGFWGWQILAVCASSKTAFVLLDLSGNPGLQKHQRYSTPTQSNPSLPP
ncbi:hypothetical protein ALP62_03072 [Pseudomonas syringae pv. aceris]|nr:hypothetical protein ALP62_03072 [Pseudomonas syringae pv. aceris]